MAYLAKDDYATHIQRDHFDAQLGQAAELTGITGAALLVKLEKQAEAEIRAFLIGVYKIADELAKTPDDVPDTRNELLKRCYANIVLYYLATTITTSDVEEVRMREYEDARKLLDAMREETIDPELEKNDDVDLIRKTKITSNEKFIYHPHDDPTVAGYTTQPVNPNP